MYYPICKMLADNSTSIPNVKVVAGNPECPITQINRNPFPIDRKSRQSDVSTFLLAHAPKKTIKRN